MNEVAGSGAGVRTFDHLEKGRGTCRRTGIMIVGMVYVCNNASTPSGQSTQGKSSRLGLDNIVLQNHTRAMVSERSRKSKHLNPQALREETAGQQPREILCEFTRMALTSS